jgi:hypothetical protein
MGVSIQPSETFVSIKATDTGIATPETTTAEGLSAIEELETICAAQFIAPGILAD